MAVERRWLRADEVSELLHLNLKTVYRGISSGRIPGRRIPGIGVRVDRLRLDGMLSGDIPVTISHVLTPKCECRGKGRKR